MTQEQAKELQITLQKESWVVKNEYFTSKLRAYYPTFYLEIRSGFHEGEFETALVTAELCISKDGFEIPEAAEKWISEVREDYIECLEKNLALPFTLAPYISYKF